MMPIYLGISSKDCDVTVTFLKDEKIVYAAQEERFTRKKKQDGFPYGAIEDGLNFLGIKINDIEAIGFGWLKPKEERRLYLKTGWLSIRQSFGNKAPLFQPLRHSLNVIRRGLFVNYREWVKSHNTLLEGLNRIGYLGKVEYFHHQLCHIASAYYTSGFDKSLVVSLDGYGSGCASGY